MAAPFQPTLFDGGAPFFDPGFAGLRRIDLGLGAWVDHLPEWLRGSDPLFAELQGDVRWERHRIWMYERRVDEPRLSAAAGPEVLERWPILAEIGRVLETRYGVLFRSCWLNLYRDGRDGVAWHGDRVGRERPTALVADVSIGQPRRLLLRPKGGGHSNRFELGRGDLLVMGGTCQRTFEHCVPKVAHAGPRISITLRPWDAY